jgi:hypothetical protein
MRKLIRAEASKMLLWALAGTFVAVTGLVLGLYVFVFAPGSWFSLSRDPEDWAKFGEYVGGSLGALYGLLAFAGVLVTINLTREANREARRAHLNEQRPWVTFTMHPNVGLSYGQDGWHVDLQYEIKNLGKTPARRTWVFAEVIPHMLGLVQLPPEVPEVITWQGTDVRLELRKDAQTAETTNAQTSGAFGELLFPGDKSAHSFSAYPGNQSVADKLALYNYSGNFLILAGVSYQSTIDDSWHATTAQAYSLGLVGFPGVPPQRVGPLKIQLVNGQFALGQRRANLEPAPLADGYAT